MIFRVYEINFNDLSILVGTTRQLIPKFKLEDCVGRFIVGKNGGIGYGLFSCDDVSNNFPANIDFRKKSQRDAAIDFANELSNYLNLAESLSSPKGFGIITLKNDNFSESDLDDNYSNAIRALEVVNQKHLEEFLQVINEAHPVLNESYRTLLEKARKSLTSYIEI